MTTRYVATKRVVNTLGVAAARVYVARRRADHRASVSCEREWVYDYDTTTTDMH